MSVDRWRRADDMARHWDAVWDALEDAETLLTEGVSEDPIWYVDIVSKTDPETGDDFDPDKLVAKARDFAAEQTRHWEQRAEKLGRAMLATASDAEEGQWARR